jgi:hypothetical protein
MDKYSNSPISFVQFRHWSGIEFYMIIFDVQVCHTCPTSFVQVCVKKCDSKHISGCNVIVKIKTSASPYI